MTLACVLSIGCSGEPKFIYIGTWHGNRNLTLPEADRYTAKSLGEVTLVIKDNGRFELNEMGIPSKGEVDFSPDHAELHIKEFMQRPVEARGANAEKEHPDIKLTPQEDGSLLFDNPVAVDGKPLGLNKIKD
jgi:hypothetical protein